MKGTKHPSQIVLYAKAPQDDQELGCEEQLQGLRNFCEMRDIEILWEFSEYIALKATARVELHAAAEKAKASDCPLLVWRQALLGKDSSLIAALIKVKYGVRLYSVEIGFEDDPAVLMKERTLGVIAEFEREVISNRTKAALAAKRERGEIIGGDAKRAAAASAVVRSQKADEKALKIWDIVDDIKQSVFAWQDRTEMTQKEIVAEMNNRKTPKLNGGIPGETSGEWTAPELNRILKRVETKNLLN